METTPKSLHNSSVDLYWPREVVYHDRGYFGVDPRGYNATMRQAVRAIRWVSGIGS